MIKLLESEVEELGLYIENGVLKNTEIYVKNIIFEVESLKKTNSYEFRRKMIKKLKYFQRA
jgi:hypothetical protein